MRYKTARGFSLLEVLIALLIFSLGLMGLAGLMVVSVRTNQSAFLRTQASFLAQSLADRMRANTGKINSYIGTYDSSSANAAYVCSSGICTPDLLVERDKALWSALMVSSLPNPTAIMACNGVTLGGSAQSGSAPYSGLCTLTMTWTEAKLDRSSNVSTGDSNAPTTQTFAWVFQP
ncbi:MAG: type IV pilus modification protein PilV [Dokdonella sp.]